MGDNPVGSLIGLAVGLYVAKKVWDVVVDDDGSYKCGACGKRYAHKIDAQNCCLKKKEAARRKEVPQKKSFIDGVF